MILDDADFEFGTAFNFSFEGDDIAVEVPAVPKVPTGSPAVPDAPAVPRTSKKIVIKNGNNLLTDAGSKSGKPMIIINGQVMQDNEMVLRRLDPSIIKSVQVYKDAETIKKYGDDAREGVIVISTDGVADMGKLHSSAMKTAREAVNSAGHGMGSSEELEQARMEMAKAKEELMQMKKEMDAARAELDKARRELKKK